MSITDILNIIINKVNVIADYSLIEPLPFSAALYPATGLRHYISAGQSALCDDRPAEWYAEERARLSSKGLTPSFVDGQIAAISVVNGLIPVTLNIEDFKQFLRLKLENRHFPKSGYNLHQLKSPFLASKSTR